MSRAARAGLALEALGFYRESPEPDAPAGLVIGCGRPPAHAFAGEVDTLCDVLG